MSYVCFNVFSPSFLTTRPTSQINKQQSCVRIKICFDLLCKSEISMPYFNIWDTLVNIFMLRAALGIKAYCYVLMRINFALYLCI